MYFWKMKIILFIICQDVDKKGRLRFVANTFPSYGFLWNYGALPQTWEDPNHMDTLTKYNGDGDPVDIIDIGSTRHQSGEVIQVKVLGTLAMIDQGQTDWKVISIDIRDPLANKMTDVSDVDYHMPGLLKTSIEWLKYYKVSYT